jgi:hypothetical protein
VGCLVDAAFLSGTNAGMGVISSGTVSLGVVAMRRILQALTWIFIAPGDWVSTKFGVSQADNRDLVRMLVNSLFWIVIVVIGLAIWTSTMPEYQ